MTTIEKISSFTVYITSICHTIDTVADPDLELRGCFACPAVVFVAKLIIIK